jgi:hypothetical protein
MGGFNSEPEGSGFRAARGGEMVTKPLVFEGGNLRLNFETSSRGERILWA